MNIISALMTTDVRLAYEYRWLVYDKTTEEWVVYESKLDIRRHEVGRTKSQDQAIEWLLDES